MKEINTSIEMPLYGKTGFTVSLGEMTSSLNSILNNNDTFSHKGVREKSWYWQTNGQSDKRAVLKIDDIADKKAYKMAYAIAGNWSERLYQNDKGGIDYTPLSLTVKRGERGERMEFSAKSIDDALKNAFGAFPVGNTANTEISFDSDDKIRIDNCENIIENFLKLDNPTLEQTGLFLANCKRMSAYGYMLDEIGVRDMDGVKNAVITVRDSNMNETAVSAVSLQSGKAFLVFGGFPNETAREDVMETADRISRDITDRDIREQTAYDIISAYDRGETPVYYLNVDRPLSESRNFLRLALVEAPIQSALHADSKIDCCGNWRYETQKSNGNLVLIENNAAKTSHPLQTTDKNIPVVCISELRDAVRRKSADYTKMVLDMVSRNPVSLRTTIENLEKHIPQRMAADTLFMSSLCDMGIKEFMGKNTEYFSDIKSNMGKVACSLHAFAELEPVNDIREISQRLSRINSPAITKTVVLHMLSSNPKDVESLRTCVMDRNPGTFLGFYITASHEPLLALNAVRDKSIEVSSLIRNCMPPQRENPPGAEEILKAVGENNLSRENAGKLAAEYPILKALSKEREDKQDTVKEVKPEINDTFRRKSGMRY